MVTERVPGFGCRPVAATWAAAVGGHSPAWGRSAGGVRAHRVRTSLAALWIRLSFALAAQARGPSRGTLGSSSGRLLTGLQPPPLPRARRLEALFEPLSDAGHARRTPGAASTRGLPVKAHSLEVLLERWSRTQLLARLPAERGQDEGASQLRWRHCEPRERRR